MQMENKLKRLAQELRKSERGRARAKQRTLELLAGQRTRPLSLDGAVGCNVEQHTAVMEAQRRCASTS
jgi:hypothetical protein